MASLISWGLDPRKKQQQQGNVLNTLNNLDVRTNNAIVNQTRDVRQPVVNNTSVVRNNNFNQTRQTPTWQNQSRAQTPNMLNTLNNLDVRRNNALTFTQNNPFRQNNQVNQVQKPNTTLDTLAKLNQQNGGQNVNGKLSFDDFKATMNAKNAISQGGNGTPFKANAIQNAQSLINMDKNATGSLRNGDDGDYRYFTSKVMKPALGDNADVNGTTYKSILNSYNNASGDQQADIKKAISDEIITQREYAKKGSQGSLKVIDYLTDLGQFLDKNGNTKGKSLGKQIGDYMSTGGIVNTLGRGVSEAVNTVGGWIFGEDAKNKANAALEKMDNSRQDLGAVGVADTALATATNYAANLGTAGLWGLANAGVNDFNAVAGTIDDRILDYDENGNAIIRHKTDKEKAGELGSAALNTAFAVAGKRGIGPSLEASAKDAATGLAKLSAKDLAKYAAKELPWAGGTTLAETALNNLSQGKEWNDMNIGKMAKDFLFNLGQDVGMDAAGYNTSRIAQRNAAAERLRQAEDAAVAQDPSQTRNMSPYEREMGVRAPAEQPRNRISEVADNIYTNLVNKNAINRLAQGIEKGANGDIKFARVTKEMLADINAIREAKGLDPLTQRQVTAYKNAVNNNLNNRYKENPEVMTPTRIAEIAFDSLTNPNAEALPGKGENTVNVTPYTEKKYNGSVIGLAQDGGTSLKSIEPRYDSEVQKMRQQKSDLLSQPGSPLVANQEGGVTQTGTSLVHPRAGSPDTPLGVLNSSISQDGQNSKHNRNSEDYSASLGKGKSVKGMPTEINISSKDAERYQDRRIKDYYNKYGNDFYEKMPDNLKEHYETMLDAQPRNKDGIYTDPITGGRSIDESASAKSSKFANETVAKSEEVSDKLQGQVKENQASYRPTSNAEHLAASEEFIKSRSLSQAESDITNRVLNKKVGDISDQDVSDAIAVAKKLDAKGDNASLERASTIYESLSKHATKKGQAIQALSLLNNRTPEGLRYGAEKAIAKGGTEVTPEIHKQVVEDTNRIVNARKELTKAQSAFQAVQKRAKTLYESGNKNISNKDYQQIMSDLDMSGRRLDNAKHSLDVSYGNLSKTVADQTKQTASSIYSSIHKGGLLSAPTTHIKNITSNTTFGVMNKISDVPAAAMDAMISKITGKRTKTITGRGIINGGAKGTRYGMEQMKTGIDELSGDGGKYTSGFPELRFKNKVLDFLVGKPNRVIFRAMGAGDKPFRYSAQANSLYDQAISEAKNLGIKGKAREIFVKQFVADPPQAALEKSWQDGERAVLGQDNMVSSIVSSAVKKMQNSDNVGTKAIGTFLDAHVVPFVKVPTNFLIETSKYTPVGEVAEAGKIINDAVHGRGFDQRAFVEATSKSSIGTAGLVALGGLLADNFTGEYPEDEKERNRWEAEGIKENSVKIGDRYVPLEAFGPASLLMGSGAQFWKSMKEGDGVLDSTTQALAQLGRSIEDQSFLTGISNVLDVMEGNTSVGGSATNYLKQEVASNVPNIIKKLADATDPYKRSTGKKDGVLEQTVAQVMNSVPFLRELLPAKVDAYGNDLKNGAFLSGFLDPTGSGQELQGGNEMIEEVARLHNIAGDLDLTDDEKKELEVTPADIGYKFGKQGSEVTLTDAEQRELTKKTGQLISSTWQDTMQTDEYKNADDLTKARLLADGRAAAVNLAKQQFGEEHDYEAPKMTTDAKKLEKGTFKAKAKSSSGDGRKNEIEINDTIADDHKAVLEHYNSMDSDEWKEYIYGDSKENAEAEYNLAKAKYENDVANDKLTKVEKIKRQKEISKLEISKNWSKEVRDVYSLAGTKDDIQELLNGLEGEERETMVGRLNALNEAMYNAGEISKNTYTSRWRNINNFEKSSSSSSKSGSSDNSPSPALSSGAAAAQKAATKAIASEDLSGYKVKTTGKPGNSTMQKSQMKSYTNKKYTPKKANISVKKGK